MQLNSSLIVVLLVNLHFTNAIYVLPEPEHLCDNGYSRSTSILYDTFKTLLLPFRRFKITSSRNVNNRNLCRLGTFRRRLHPLRYRDNHVRIIHNTPLFYRDHQYHDEHGHGPHVIHEPVEVHHIPHHEHTVHETIHQPIHHEHVQHEPIGHLEDW